MKPQEHELTKSEWLKVLTNKFITAEQIALVQGCSLKKARRIVEQLSPSRIKGTPYITLTDSYLTKYHGTDRKTELRIIYERD